MLQKVLNKRNSLTRMSLKQSRWKGRRHIAPAEFVVEFSN